MNKWNQLLLVLPTWAGAAHCGVSLYHSNLESPLLAFFQFVVVLFACWDAFEEILSLHDGIASEPVHHLHVDPNFVDENIGCPILGGPVLHLVDSNEDGQNPALVLFVPPNLPNVLVPFLFGAPNQRNAPFPYAAPIQRNVLVPFVNQGDETNAIVPFPYGARNRRNLLLPFGAPNQDDEVQDEGPESFEYNGRIFFVGSLYSITTQKDHGCRCKIIRFDAGYRGRAVVDIYTANAGEDDAPLREGVGKNFVSLQSIPGIVYPCRG